MSSISPSLLEPASKQLPKPAGTAIDRNSLRDLAIYTSGGLRLQSPDAVTDEETMAASRRNRRPNFASGEKRLCTSASIGLFGYAAVRPEGSSFANLSTENLLPEFGLGRTFLQLQKTVGGRYASGAT